MTRLLELLVMTRLLELLRLEIPCVTARALLDLLDLLNVLRLLLVDPVAEEGGLDHGRGAGELYSRGCRRGKVLTLGDRSLEAIAWQVEGEGEGRRTGLAEPGGR